MIMSDMNVGANTAMRSQKWASWLEAFPQVLFDDTIMVATTSLISQGTSGMQLQTEAAPDVYAVCMS